MPLRRPDERVDAFGATGRRPTIVGAYVGGAIGFPLMAASFLLAAAVMFPVRDPARPPAAVETAGPVAVTFENGSSLPHNLTFTGGQSAATRTVVDPAPATVCSSFHRHRAPTRSSARSTRGWKAS